MGSSVQRLKENKQRERGGSENNEKRKGDVCFEKKKSIDGERGMAMEMEVISGDLRPWSCIEVCTADTSVMDFRMC